MSPKFVLVHVLSLTDNFCPDTIEKVGFGRNAKSLSEHLIGYHDTPI